jgi:hypothetical protein
MQKINGREAPVIPEPENKKEIVQETKENLTEAGAGIDYVPKEKVVIKGEKDQPATSVVDVVKPTVPKPGGRNSINRRQGCSGEVREGEERKGKEGCPKQERKQR